MNDFIDRFSNLKNRSFKKGSGGKKLKQAKSAKGDCQLAPLDYHKFWQEIIHGSSPKHTDEAAVTFLKGLLERVILLEGRQTREKEEKRARKGDAFIVPFLHHHCLPRKPEASMAPDDQIVLLKDSVLRTVKYLLSFSNIKLGAVMSHDLVNFIASKWKAVSQNPGVCRAITREIEVATTLYEARHSESSMDKDLSRKESLNLVHISCMYVPSLPHNTETSVVTNLSDFEWLFYRRKLLYEKDGFIFSELCKLIATLPKRLKSDGLSLDSTLTSFCAHLVFLRQLLMEGAPYDAAMLEKKLLPQLQLFCSWPYPYGTMAQELEFLVSSELRSPGSVWRAQLFEEYPLLSEAGISSRAREKLGQGNKFDCWPEMQRTVILFASSTDFRAQMIADAFRHTRGPATSETQKIIETQKQVLYAVFEQTLDIVDPDTPAKSKEEQKTLADSGGWRRSEDDLKKALAENDPLKLEHISQEALESAYLRTIRIMDEAKENSTWPIKIVKEWTASMLGQVVKGLNPRLIVLPSFHSSSGNLHIRNEAAIDRFRRVGRTIMHLKKAQRALQSFGTSQPSPTSQEEEDIPPPPSCGPAEGVLAPPRREGDQTPAFSLPDIQLEFNEQYSFKPLNEKLWNGNFSKKFAAEFLGRESVDIRNKSSSSSGVGSFLVDQEEQEEEKASLSDRILQYPEARTRTIFVKGPDGNIMRDATGAAVARKKFGCFLKACHFANKNTAKTMPGKGASPKRHGGGIANRRRTRTARRKRASLLARDHILETWRGRQFSEVALAGLMAQDVADETSGDKMSSTIRICAIGDDSTVHRILCNYVTSMQDWGKSLSKLNFKFYLLPTSKRRSVLASCLARKDAWYRRHIFNPFSAPSDTMPYDVSQTRLSMGEIIHWLKAAAEEVAPKKKDKFFLPLLRESLLKKAEDEGMTSNLARLYVEVEQMPLENSQYNDMTVDGMTVARLVTSIMGVVVEGMQQSIAGKCAPSAMLSNLLQDYIRLAKYVMPICVFECECWESKDNRATMFRVPFCFSAELGIRPEALLYKKGNVAEAGKGNKADSFSSYFNDYEVEDIMASGEFQKKMGLPQAVLNDVSVVYQAVGAGGYTGNVEETTFAEESFFHIAVSNIPCHNDAIRKRDLGSLAHIPNFELHVVPKNHSKFPSALATVSKYAERKANGRLGETDIASLTNGLLEGGSRAMASAVTVTANQQKKDSDEKFMISLDGQLFGPFQKVVLKQLKTADGSTMFFPISTFFPC